MQEDMHPYKKIRIYEMVGLPEGGKALQSNDGDKA